jgi:hypothetical protein
MARLRIRSKWTPYRYGEGRGASARAQGKDAKATDIIHHQHPLLCSFTLSFSCLVIIVAQSLKITDNAGLILCQKYPVIRRFSHETSSWLLALHTCSPTSVIWRNQHTPFHTHSQIRPWTQKARRRARQGGEARRSCNRLSTKSASVSGEPVRGECPPTFPKPSTQSHRMATTTKRPTLCHQAPTGRWTTSGLTKDSKTMKRRV